MRVTVQHLADEQRRAWADYAERLHGLEGAEYEAAEADAWDELQETLQHLGLASDPADAQSV